MKIKESCPRFHFYYGKMHGCNVLWLSRNEWDEFQMSFGSPVQLEIENLPLSGVAKNATVVACEAYLSTGGNYQINLYRLDPHDYPKEYNKDSYTIIENVLDIPNYHEIVKNASTEDNDNLQKFLYDNVCIIKQANPENHHMRYDELPMSVQTKVDFNQRIV